MPGILINQFINHFLISDIAPLGKIGDWFYRVEYQQRGSPHIHMLIWLEDTPVFGVDDNDRVTAFIDKIITCKLPLAKLPVILKVTQYTVLYQYQLISLSKITNILIRAD